MKMAKRFDELSLTPKKREKEFSENHAAGICLYCWECGARLGYLFFGCKTVVCHRCETEQFVDMEAYVAHLETENERLREGWISAECGARNGWGDCNATCPLKMGEYCEAVRKVVEA